jgi:hypothetical protein
MKKNGNGKMKLLVLVIALGVGWVGCYLTTGKHPAVGVFLLFASIASLSRIPSISSRALAILAIGAWYLAFPQNGGQQGGQMILLPILTGGSAFLIVLLLREIVGALLEGGEGEERGSEGASGGREKGK